MPAPQRRTCPQRLFAAHQGLIRLTMARHFARVLADPDRREAAWTAAALGLWDACRRHDPARGVSFAAFAVPTIRGHVLRHLWREHRPERQREAAGLEVVPLDAPPGEDGETWHERIADASAEEPGAALVDAAGFEALIAPLPLRQRDLLRALYRDGEGRAAVAARWGVSVARVGQLHDRAMERLRMERLRADAADGEAAAFGYPMSGYPMSGYPMKAGRPHGNAGRE